MTWPRSASAGRAFFAFGRRHQEALHSFAGTRAAATNAIRAWLHSICCNRDRTVCDDTCRRSPRRRPQASRTIDQDDFGELRAKILGRGERIEELLAEPLRLRDADILRSYYLELAAGRGVDQPHRGALGKSEIDENRRIVDFDLEMFRLDRMLKRQREI